MSDERNTWPFHLLVETESGAKVYGEELYQAFKARLMRELVADDGMVQPAMGVPYRQVLSLIERG